MLSVVNSSAGVMQTRLPASWLWIHGIIGSFATLMDLGQWQDRICAELGVPSEMTGCPRQEENVGLGVIEKIGHWHILPFMRDPLHFLKSVQTFWEIPISQPRSVETLAPLPFHLPGATCPLVTYHSSSCWTKKMMNKSMRLPIDNCTPSKDSKVRYARLQRVGQRSHLNDGHPFEKGRQGHGDIRGL
jgi:hypothetical protein